MTETKRITSEIPLELDKALDESARKKNKKKMPYICEIITKYIEEEKLETENRENKISKTDKKRKTS